MDIIKLTLKEALPEGYSPVKLAQHLDKLCNDGVFAADGDILFCDIPRKLKTKSSQNEQKTYDLYMYELSFLPKTDYAELNRVFMSGDKELRQNATEGALYIVPAIANLYTDSPNVDVLQAGNEGLLEAVEDYEILRHEVPFVSYAVLKIRHGILTYADEQIKHQRDDRGMYERSQETVDAYRRITAEKGSPPDAQELAREAGVDEGFARLIIEQIKEKEARGEDNPHEEKEVPHFERMTETDDAASERVEEILLSLPDTAREAIKRTFGIGCRKQTAEEAAKDLDMSVEEIENIISSAFSIIRKNNNGGN